MNSLQILKDWQSVQLVALCGRNVVLGLAVIYFAHAVATTTGASANEHEHRVSRFVAVMALYLVSILYFFEWLIQATGFQLN